MTDAKRRQRPDDALSTQATGRRLVGLYEMPKDLAEMSDEEIDEFARAIVAQARAALRRPDKR